ncbi:MAG: hypothetical protein IBX57_01030 [Gammaproteobacteria bacterium]|nr:hypothetical protein [Gammaproteobacteria bacterium]
MSDNKLPDNQTSPNISAEGHIDLVVSQEFLSIDKLKEGFTNFLKSAAGFFTKGEVTNKFSEEWLAGSALVMPSKKFEKAIDKVGYINIRLANVYTPPGMNVKYNQYVEALDKAVDAATKVMEEVLNPYARYLAENINDPDSLLKGGGVNIKDFEPHDIDGLSLKLGKCFKRGSNKYEAKFGDVFSSNKDAADVLKNVSTVSSKALTINKRELISKVEEIGGYLDKLYEIMSEDEYQDVSKRAVDNLYKITFTCARELEFVSVVIYQLTSLNVALNDTIKKIER